MDSVADLTDQCNDAEPEGPFGGLTRGARSERPVLDAWRFYSALGSDDRLVVQEVWAGIRDEALVAGGGFLHRVTHAPAGLPDPSGKRYGFEVRSVPLPVPPPPPPPPPPPHRALAVLAALLLTAGGFAGGLGTSWAAPGWTDGLFGNRPPDPPTPAWAAPPPAGVTPAHRPAAAPDRPPAVADRRRNAADELDQDIDTVRKIGEEESQLLHRLRELNVAKRQMYDRIARNRALLAVPGAIGGGP